MNGWKIFIGTLAIGALLILGIKMLTPNRQSSINDRESLVFYCAAGIQNPVDAVVKQYQKEYGISIQVSYGGSGTLLSNLQIAKTGDLYLAADESYIHKAREKGLIAEVIPLATIEPVLAVAKGNPKQIETIDDLLRDDVRLAIANPDAASVGRTTRELLLQSGKWDAVNAHVDVLKPTVNDITNDVKIGSVDVGIVWDAVAAQYPELEIVRSPILSKGQQQVSIAVLTSSERPTNALRFARYLGARDRGLLQFAADRFNPVEGDEWAERPRVTLYSGGVNRLAIENTIKRFQEREGVEIDTVYNGCGILVGQMKLGERPDAYFSCDVSFVRQVRDLFFDPLNISETDMVIVVQKDNPKEIQGLKDLTQSGLRLGVANAEQSALGALTKRMLEGVGVYDDIMPNVKSQTPTADLLVNQIRTGSLDAAIVYEANTPYVRDALDIIHIDSPAAKAVQPYAVGKSTKYPHLMTRLMGAIRSEESRSKFQSIGFRWLADREER